ncbi:MAG: SIMPL domain-containing protein [Bacteroidales bacterium]|nr:SIMPL domain-containing protein [Bacteroidales bacterium]
MDKARIPAALLLMCGLLGFGVLMKNAIENFAQKDSYVSVKGLAEREVPADKVVWPISLKDVGNDLSDLYDMMTTKTNKVKAFLKKNGIKEDEISMSATSVYDRQAERYSSDNISTRYQVTKTITVTSNKVNLIRELMSSQEELLKQGVAIAAGESWEGNMPTFEFTGLNELKPQMIEEATKNARVVAEKFASDSKSELGKIKYANQGQFSIYDRDDNTPYIKTVRVVTTIDYYLN